MEEAGVVAPPQEPRSFQVVMDWLRGTITGYQLRVILNLVWVLQVGDRILRMGGTQMGGSFTKV